MILSKVIKHLHPEAEPLKDYKIMDNADGKGAFIAEWNILAPEPTAEEIQTAWNEIKSIPVEVTKTVQEQLEEERANSKRLEARLDQVNNDLLSFIEYQMGGA